MKQIGTCKDRKGNVSPLFEENGKHYRRNPPAKIIDGNQDHSNQTIKGIQDHSNQTIDGNQYHGYQTIGGNQYHRCQTIKGNQDHSNQTIGGDIYIKGLKQGDKKLQKHLDEFYKTKQEKYTWATFFEWITKGD